MKRTPEQQALFDTFSPEKQNLYSELQKRASDLYVCHMGMPAFDPVFVQMMAEFALAELCDVGMCSIEMIKKQMDTRVGDMVTEVFSHKEPSLLREILSNPEIKKDLMEYLPPKELSKIPPEYFDD